MFYVCLESGVRAPRGDVKDVWELHEGGRYPYHSLSLKFATSEPVLINPVQGGCCREGVGSGHTRWAPPSVPPTVDQILSIPDPSPVIGVRTPTSFVPQSSQPTEPLFP